MVVALGSPFSPSSCPHTHLDWETYFHFISKIFFLSESRGRRGLLNLSFSPATGMKKTHLLRAGVWGPANNSSRRLGQDRRGDTVRLRGGPGGGRGPREIVGGGRAGSGPARALRPRRRQWRVCNGGDGGRERGGGGKKGGAVTETPAAGDPATVRPLGSPVAGREWRRPGTPGGSTGRRRGPIYPSAFSWVSLPGGDVTCWRRARAGELGRFLSAPSSAPPPSLRPPHQPEPGPVLQRKAGLQHPPPSPPARLPVRWVPGVAAPAGPRARVAAWSRPGRRPARRPSALGQAAWRAAPSRPRGGRS